MKPTEVTAEPTLWARFPANQHVQRLLGRCRSMGVHLATSPVHEQWLYHPAYRSIYVWEPDLDMQSLSYLVVIMAHELGHAVDFDANPEHVTLTHDLHWSQTPAFIERAAFVNGFCILKELDIPVSLEHYTAMIEEPMGQEVVAEIERDHLCCLLSPSRCPTAALAGATREKQLPSSA